MPFLRRLLGPRNSILLAFDHLEPAGVEDFEARVEEVGRYYDLVSVSEISSRLPGRGALGLAAIVFTEARQSLFLRAAPILRGRGIPFTVFCRPDCLGTNRLPSDEEARLYLEKVPGARGLATGDPRILRERLGPLPYDEIDPTLFFIRWGRLRDFPPELVEVGVRAGVNDQLRQDAEFIRTVLQREVRTAFSDGKVPVERLREAGLAALATRRTGAINRGTSPTDLPVWPLEE